MARAIIAAASFGLVAKPVSACESAPKWDPFSSPGKHLIPARKCVRGGVRVGADRDSCWSRAFSVRSATYAEISWGPTSVLIHIRFLHDFPIVHCRSISGSLLHWRISGGSETFLERSEARVVVASHRGTAAQRSVIALLLRTTSGYQDDVHPSAESLAHRKSATNKSRNSA
jgi:hypothetical protein